MGEAWRTGSIWGKIAPNDKSAGRWSVQGMHSAARPGWMRNVTRYQGLVFLVCWLGWMLDIINFTLFALVLRPALTDLLGG